MFEQVTAYLGDPIFSLVEQFHNDPNDAKVNLSIGLYYNEQGKIPQLASVKQALSVIQTEQLKKPSLYLPMEGLPAYRSAVLPLIFGKDHPCLLENRVAFAQTIGGSGALKIGADFLHNYYANATVWVSDPTWENHKDIFAGAGFKLKSYPYFDSTTLRVDCKAMLAAIEQAAPQDIILLHPCCHNPTGADLTPQQWDTLIPILQQKQLIPFLDMAYQGLGKGLNEDAYAIRAMAKAGLTLLVANSFSKIFSLYGERIGALSVVCEANETAERVQGQLKATIRRNYSSPPTLGAQIVSRVLTEDKLIQTWLQDVEQMRVRINSMRQMLANKLLTLGVSQVEHLTQQQGMFSYTGFNKEQITRLRTNYSIYLLDSGRMCVAGLTNDNIDKIAQAFAAIQK